MKKVFIGLICSLLFVGLASANTNIEVWVGGDSPTSGVHLDGGIFAPYFVGASYITDADISGNATVAGSVTTATLRVTSTSVFSGKSTLNGELEVNQATVDINLKNTSDVIDITQTNEAGTASTPLINIGDKRTGSTANEASEAGIYIDSDGAYAITIADGILQIEAEIDTASGDILLDPAGSEVHIDGGVHVGGTDAVGDNNLKVDGTFTQVGVATFTAESVHNGGIDANYITVDAAAGIDTKTAGELKIGAATATSVTIGDAGTTVEVASSDWTISTAGAIANCSMTADQLAAGSPVSAINGAAITNIAVTGVTGEALTKATVFTGGSVVGAWNTLAISNGFSTNVRCVAEAGVTNLLSFTNGILYYVTTAP